MSGIPFAAAKQAMDHHPIQAEKVESDAAVQAVLDKYEGVKLANKEIEEFFVWPDGARPDIKYDEFDVEIPVIDLAPVLKLKRLQEEKGEVKAKSEIDEEIEACEVAKAGVERAIRAACEEYGFFQIVNHGIPMEVVEQFTECFRQIFDLPLEEKMKVQEEHTLNGISKPGYTSMKRSNAFSRTGNSHIWNEGFDVESPEVKFPGRLEEQTKTVWPEGSVNSKQSGQFRFYSDEYEKQSSKLSLLVLDLMAASLGLPEGSVEGLLGYGHDAQVSARLRINHFPVCTQPDLTWGIHCHTDPSVITVLHQDAVGGLQIGFKDGTWHGLRPIPGAFVVNVGDFLQAWTNGRFLSAEHRVVANENSRRFSIAYFVLAERGNEIRPRPELVDAEHPVLYKPFSILQYFQALKARGMGKTRGQLLTGAFGIDNLAV